MNKNRFPLVGGVLLLGGLASCSPTSTDSPNDQEEAEAQISEIERAWAQVAVTGDPSVIERILADDFLGTSPEGVLYTKQEFINDTKVNPLGFTANELNEMKVRFFGDVAVAQGHETFTRKDGGTGRFVWTDVLLRRDGRWLIVAAQDVIVPVNTTPQDKGLFDNSPLPERGK